MQSLDVFFKSHFDTKEISDDNLRQFSEDHLRRLAQSGRYPALVVVMEKAYGDYFGAIADEATRAAMRGSRTRAMKLAMDAFKDELSRREGRIRSDYGVDSAIYLEFFPQGISEYRGADLGNIEEKMARFAKALEAHETELGSAFVDLFTNADAAAGPVGLIPRFQAARKVQLEAKGSVSTLKMASEETRTALEVQLMKNVLTIALDYVGDPASGLAFFDQSIIRRDQGPGEEKAAAKP